MIGAYVIVLVIFALAGGLFRTIAKRVGGLDGGPDSGHGSD